MFSRDRHRMGALALFCVLSLLTASALAVDGQPAEIASYRISAALDPERREVTGQQLLRWRNDTERAATELRFHLYLNAFANNRTTLMSAVPDEARRWARRHPDGWGGIEVTAVRIGGEDVTKQLEFIQPDDLNPHDRTVARLPLKTPVTPGRSIEVEMSFVSRLPRLFMRSGHAAPFFFVAQWFPKIGVFEKGRWNCHQYHATTEFYADFGTYEVSLTVPADFVVGHTGVAVSEHRNGTTRTIEVRAEAVHDFAWTADPRFRLIEEEVAGSRVRLLMQPNHLGQTDRYLDTLRATMARYEAWFGPYPYAELTLVDPPVNGLAAGGMEYPMLFTAGTLRWMPRALRIPEMLTVHEFGHQYWHGIVANDEVEAAWLDEGINSYVEGRIMDELFGPRGSYLDLFGLQLDAVARHRLSYSRVRHQDPITRPAHRMLDRRSYRSITYGKTVLVLLTLDRYLGGERLRDALAAYHRKWRFRHPTGADWRAAVEESTGEDLEWFFTQTLDGTGVLDYAVTRLRVEPIPPLEGWRVRTDRELGTEKHFRSEVIVERLGSVQMPVNILVVFEDGSQSHESWNGRDRWRRLEITSKQRADFVVVDPDHQLPLDANRINNSRMRSPGTRGIIRVVAGWTLWLQNLLQLLTGI